MTSFSYQLLCQKTFRVLAINSEPWNPKQIFLNACFSWMMNQIFTSKMGCFGFQDCVKLEMYERDRFFLHLMGQLCSGFCLTVFTFFLAFLVAGFFLLGYHLGRCFFGCGFARGCKGESVLESSNLKMIQNAIWVFPKIMVPPNHPF